MCKQTRYPVSKVQRDCTFLQSVDGVKYYEHPTYGDEGPVIAIYENTAWWTMFYDPFNSTDTEYVKEDYTNGDISAHCTTEWEEYDGY